MHIKDLSYNHMGNFAAGSSGYYEHTGAARWKKRGVVTVESRSDARVWVYKKNGYKPTEWRAWIKLAFIDSSANCDRRLAGHFPAYWIESI